MICRWLRKQLLIRARTPINRYCTSVKHCFTRHDQLSQLQRRYGIVYRKKIERTTDLAGRDLPRRLFVWSNYTWSVAFNYSQPSRRRFVRLIDTPSDLLYSDTDPTTMDNTRGRHIGLLSGWNNSRRLSRHFPSNDYRLYSCSSARIEQ